ncbi:MAG: OmpH family outer membrane protein [Bacteroidales bacterium]
MKNVNYLINGVLAAAIVVLFAMQFSSKKTSQGDATASGSTVSEVELLPMAYIDVDSLLKNYNFVKDMNEVLLSKQEKARLNLNEKVRQLENEMREFQRKVENNAFLSRERAESEQNRLIKKQQELQQLEQRLSMDFMNEQQKVNEQLRDSINSFIKFYNKDKKYHMILSNTQEDNLFYADEKYNITSDVVKSLNSRYNVKK